jgi:ketosteroid isomerase-like protein
VAGTTKVTVETLRRLVDAFNAHDLDAVMGFFTDDCDLFEFRGDKITRKDSYWKLVEP